MYTAVVCTKRQNAGERKKHAQAWVRAQARMWRVWPTDTGFGVNMDTNSVMCLERV